jgi:drug/metabolite transporter (DMT)-like permease
MIPTRWAYLAVFIGVCGHASSEFFAVLSGIAGPEVSVWRYTIGAAGLVVWALINPSTRDLWTPLRETWTRLVPLSLIGVSVTYLAFHWALDFASVIQVATVVTTIPIFVGLSNLIVNGAYFLPFCARHLGHSFRSWQSRSLAFMAPFASPLWRCLLVGSGFT